MRYIELFAGIGGFRYGLENMGRTEQMLSSRQSNNRNFVWRGNEKEEQGVFTCGFNGDTQKGRLKQKADVFKQGSGSIGCQPNKRQHTFTCVWANEWNKYACQIYRKNFGKEELYEGDIKKVSAEIIPNFDFLVGGFPCQRFSIAGKRKGMSGEDTRGSEFYEIYRIAKVRQPKLLLLENVPGLFSSRGGEDFYTILKSLDEIGYDVEWDCINTSIFLPQNRERVFIIGHLRGKGGQKVFPIGEGNQEVNELQRQRIVSNTVKPDFAGAAACTYIEYKELPQKIELKYEGAIMSEKNKKWLEDGKELSRNFPQGQRVYSDKGIASTIAGNAGGLGGKTGLYTIPVLTPDRIKKRQHGRRFKENREPSFTLTGQDIHGISDGTKIRRLTPTECERLQGFPDGWTEGISDSQRYKCLGNAVTTNVITEIGKKILDKYNE